MDEICASADIQLDRIPSASSPRPTRQEFLYDPNHGSVTTCATGIGHSPGTARTDRGPGADSCGTGADGPQAPAGSGVPPLAAQGLGVDQDELGVAVFLGRDCRWQEGSYLPGPKVSGKRRDLQGETHP